MPKKIMSAYLRVGTVAAKVAFNLTARVVKVAGSAIGFGQSGAEGGATSAPGNATAEREAASRRESGDERRGRGESSNGGSAEARGQSQPEASEGSTATEPEASEGLTAAGPEASTAAEPGLATASPDAPPTPPETDATAPIGQPTQGQEPALHDETAPATQAPALHAVADPATPLHEEAEPATALDPESDRAKTIDDEPELVEEFAEPGAEQGAGATIQIDEPWEGYSQLNADAVIERIGDASTEELAVIELYERAHKHRQTVLTAAERRHRSITGQGAA